LSLTIRELRQLTANLNVIATRLERDPAGFVFSGKQGYTPK
jgi:phospholipid/cholesterol/gamma-HCH transport system substrate-binding protein